MNGQASYSSAEVCKILSISRTTLWRRVKDGTMPAPIRVLGLSRWIATEVENVAADAAQDREDQRAPQPILPQPQPAPPHRVRVRQRVTA